MSCIHMCGYVCRKMVMGKHPEPSCIERIEVTLHHSAETYLAASMSHANPRSDSNNAKPDGVFLLLQGFASGSLDEDAFAPRFFVDQGLEVIVSQSYSKNLGAPSSTPVNPCQPLSTPVNPCQPLSSLAQSSTEIPWEAAHMQKMHHTCISSAAAEFLYQPQG